LDNKSLIQRYNKLPECFRWVLFLPISIISFIYSIRLWFFLTSIARSMGTYKFVFAIFHPTIVVQVLLLILIFYTAPRDKLEMVKFFIVFRSLLYFFGLLLNYALVETPDFAWYEFLLIVGEIVTLVASIGVYKILKKNIL